jgi:hypothetical protein
MIDCFETFYLNWVKQPRWTLNQAVLLIQELDPEAFIIDQDGKVRGAEHYILKHFPGDGLLSANNIRTTYHIIKIAKVDLDAGKIKEIMEPPKWIEWYCFQGLELPKNMLNAVKVHHPELFKKINNIDLEKKYLGNVSNKDSGSCPRCLDKDREIEKLKNNSSTKNSRDVNKNKMLMVIAGLIQCNYANQNNKLKSVTKQMLIDLESVGCRIEHETLKNYLIDGNDLLNKGI